MYDHINWNFLTKILQRMGFGIKWVSWVNWCISTPSFSVLINGSPKAFFRSSRGLRQGDPLSPVFVCSWNGGLSLLIDKFVSEGFLIGFKVASKSGEEAQISHMFFADDTLVFFKDLRDRMDYVSWILVWFEAFSGLKINLDKSYVLPVGSVENIEELALKLGCNIGCLPTTYLVLPPGMRRQSTLVWDGVEEIFKRKLAIWKRQYISKGGRLTLIRSTLSNLPVYIYYPSFGYQRG